MKLEILFTLNLHELPFDFSIPCYILGVLKKSEIFRSHLYGAAEKDKELQALLFAEKEDAVVGALESGKYCSFGLLDLAYLSLVIFFYISSSIPTSLIYNISSTQP